MIIRRLSIAILAVALLVSGCAGKNVRPQYNIKSIKPTITTAANSQSFWRDKVVYPFPVKYTKAKDEKGIEWEIAYMDDYFGTGKKSDAETVVLIHGRGANSGYWGNIHKALLARGKRVVAIDIPHYGKSIPGNLDKPLTRSLDDVRAVIYEVVVKQLKINKAVYLGHSLGGQTVLGYSVKYPEAVSKIILEAPGGLEEFNDVPLIHTSLRDDFAKWKKAWAVTGRLQAERARTPASVKADYYFKGAGNNPGYFYKDGEIPQYLTSVRQRMISASPKEYSNYTAMYIREIFSVADELRKSDKNNLVKRFNEIKAPVFLAMGAKDPFFPVSTLSGNSDVKLDLIKPFHDTLTDSGNIPQIKIYDNVGHFIHTDVADLFASDVLDFIGGNSIDDLEDPAAYSEKTDDSVAMPPEIKQFFDGFEKALQSKDRKQIASFYSEDFQGGRGNKKQMVDFVCGNISFISKYQVTLKSLKIEKDIAIVSGSANYGVGVSEIQEGSGLRKENGRWVWYGEVKR